MPLQLFLISYLIYIQGCPAGSYNNLTGQTNCFDCPPGYYCPGNTTTYEAFPCPAGMINCLYLACTDPVLENIINSSNVHDK